VERKSFLTEQIKSISFSGIREIYNKARKLEFSGERLII